MLKCSLPLALKKTTKMLSGVECAQAVMVGGKVYIGGVKGVKIQEYTIEKDQWKEIESPASSFGMAVMNDQLIVTGGLYEESISNHVWVLDASNNEWLQPYPNMPTSRRQSSAVGYKQWVLVVGGTKNCVEVLDTKNINWYDALELPSNAVRPSLAVIEDTLYVGFEKNVVSASLPTLIDDAMKKEVPTTEAELAKWDPLPDTPTKYPALASFHGYLLAIGERATPSSTIAMYIPNTEEWMTVAQLTPPRDSCTCLVLPDEELMVIGGKNKDGDYILDIPTHILSGI